MPMFKCSNIIPAIELDLPISPNTFGLSMDLSPLSSPTPKGEINEYPDLLMYADDNSSLKKFLKYLKCKQKKK